MNDRLDVFHFQAYIPEENRGGAYHVFLLRDGRQVGPLTPQQADAAGFPLTTIIAGINESACAEAIAMQEKVKSLQLEIETLTDQLAEAMRALSNAKALPAIGEITFHDAAAASAS